MSRELNGTQILRQLHALLGKSIYVSESLSRAILTEGDMASMYAILRKIEDLMFSIDIQIHYVCTDRAGGSDAENS